jgi:beta-galactosidase
MKKSKICSKDAPYLVSEYCGHIYPAKRFDPPMMRSEHALRHYQILDAAASTKGLSGAIAGVCMTTTPMPISEAGIRFAIMGFSTSPETPRPQRMHTRPVGRAAHGVCPLQHGRRGPSNACLDQAVVATIVRRSGCGTTMIGRYFPPRSQKVPHLAHSPVIIRDFIGERLKAESYLNERQRKSLSRLLGKVGRQAVKLTMLDTLKMGLFLMRHRKNYAMQYACSPRM